MPLAASLAKAFKFLFYSICICLSLILNRVINDKAVYIKIRYSLPPSPDMLVRLKPLSITIFFNPQGYW